MKNWLLVTGAAKRIGREIAILAASHGWGVVVHYHASAQEASDLVALLRARGARAESVAADLRDPDAVAHLVETAASRAGAALTGLVNCASVFKWDDLRTVTPESFAEHAGTNLYAPLVLCRGLAAALPPGAEGAIVNILDFKLQSPNPDHLSYSLSKYGLAGLTQLLARDLAPRIRVNAVCPGYVLPAPGQDEEDFERRSRATPLGRRAQVSDVASSVLFLLENRSVTGQSVTVDCGLHFLASRRDVALAE
ncbi:SDR family oxidoreductase [Arenibaculum pallidiluteum]|uniref:SDR family oxidoreductase n=1 Tax=Arenibaculum pallidiluteum TaxID=2812559 RepID=UPI001A96A054|nr:SDR family oxidoreductase [Arenibaculum pallidiluteum]